MLTNIAGKIINTDDLSILKAQYRENYKRPDAGVIDNHWCMLLITKSSSEETPGHRELYLDGKSYDTEADCEAAIAALNLTES